MGSKIDIAIDQMGPGNISGQAAATAIVCLVVDVVVLAARGAAKPVTKTRAGWDDWLLILAGLSNLAICGNTLFDCYNDAFGKHEGAAYLEDPDKVVLYAKSQLWWISFYILCLTFPKLVLLTLYQRIFTHRAMRIATYVLMGICAIVTMLGIIITQLMCIPISGLWDPTDTTAKCIDLTAWWTYSTVPSVVIDACIIALPIPTLVGLKLPLRDRIGLVLTFSAGGIGMGAGIARTVVSQGIMIDVTWSEVPLVIASLVECTLYLVAASLPGLRPLYLFVRRRGQFSSAKPPAYAVSEEHGLTTPPATHTQSSKSTVIVHEEHRRYYPPLYILLRDENVRRRVVIVVVVDVIATIP